MVVDFCESTGLPICLADIGMPEPTGEELMMVATKACAAGESIHNEPYEVTPRRVIHCIKAADSEGRRRKSIARGNTCISKVTGTSFDVCGD